MSETPSKSSKLRENERKRGPKSSQRRSKRAPNTLQEHQKRFKDVLKTPPNHPKSFQDHPRRPPRGSRRPSRDRKTRKSNAKEHTDVPSAPKRIQEDPECCSHIILLSDSQTLILLSSHAIVISCCDAAIRLQIISQRAIACSLLSKCRPH